MTKNALIISVLLLVLAAISCNRSESVDSQSPAISQEELVKRGAYLVTIGACHDCHSPKIMTPAGPEPDPERLLSGHPREDKIAPIAGNENWILFSQDLTAFVGPWGISYSANLTPDDTGTGSWTFEQFKTAIRKGKYKGLEGSRDLLPPMPWQMYRHFNDDDLTAIFAYLKSLKPVNNLVPPPVAAADMITASANID